MSAGRLLLLGRWRTHRLHGRPWSLFPRRVPRARRPSSWTWNSLAAALTPGGGGGGGLGVGCAERERDRTAALPTRTWGDFSIEMDGTALRRRFSEWLRGSVLFLLRWPMWEPRVVIEFVSPRSLVSYPSILVRTLGEDPTKANIKRQLRIPWYHSRASPARPVTHVVCGKHGGIPWRVRLIAWFLITSSLYRSKRSHRSIFAVWSGESWQILPLQRSATTGFSSYATKNYL